MRSMPFWVLLACLPSCTLALNTPAVKVARAPTAQSSPTTGAPSPAASVAAPTPAPTVQPLTFRKVEFTGHPPELMPLIDDGGGSGSTPDTQGPFHIGSAAGLAALAALWSTTVSAPDVDFSKEELLVLTTPSSPCGATLQSLGATPTDVSFDFGAPSCSPGPLTELGAPGVEADAYPRQNLPVVGAVDIAKANQVPRSPNSFPPDNPPTGQYERSSLAVAQDGTVWVARGYEGKVFHLSAKGAVLAQVAVPNAGNVALFPNGDVAVGTDAGITRLGPDAKVKGTPLAVSDMEDMAIDGQGRVWVSRMPAGAGVHIFPAAGAAPPQDVAVGVGFLGLAKANDGTMWAIDDQGHALLHLGPSGQVLAQLPVANGGALTIDPQGHFWTSAYQSSELLELDAQGGTLASWSLQGEPQSFQFDAAGHLWATFASTGVVNEYDVN